MKIHNCCPARQQVGSWPLFPPLCPRREGKKKQKTKTKNYTGKQTEEEKKRREGEEKQIQKPLLQFIRK